MTVLEDTIRKIEEWKKRGYTSLYDHEMRKVVDDALEILREYREKYSKIPRWIQVTERPPKEPGEYIVAYHPCHWDIESPSVKVGIDTFRGKTAWAKRKYQRVIAWQEKPEPPKEEDNG